MVEYRPLGEDYRDAFAEYTGYGFAPERGPVEYDPEEHDHERMELGDRRGLFPDDGDDPLCVCVHHWFDALVRGERHPSPRLSFVATPPEHRRQGHIEQLLARSLAEYRDRGERFSLLWPFRYRFYRQFGWETCSRSLRIRRTSTANGRPGRWPGSSTPRRRSWRCSTHPSTAR